VIFGQGNASRQWDLQVGRNYLSKGKGGGIVKKERGTKKCGHIGREGYKMGTEGGLG